MPTAGLEGETGLEKDLEGGNGGIRQSKKPDTGQWKESDFWILLG